jgi:hypothetical protein
MATTPKKRLTDKQLVEALALALESDSVELKLTVPESQRRSMVENFGMDVLDAKIRVVYFFDTPDLRCNASGVVVRARRAQGRGDDSVVKLRPVVPHELPDNVRKSPNVVVELDALPGGFVCSAAMKRVMGPDDVKRTMREGLPLRKLFSKEQRAFFAEHAPDGLTIDDLTALGPIFVFKLRWQPPDLDRKLVAELWNYPDNSRILELSTKTAPSEVVPVVKRLREYLEGHGVDLDSEQHTKTKTALEFFAGELARA